MRWTAAGAEVEHKVARLRAWMAEMGLPAVALRRVANVAWLTGGCDRVVSWAAELSPITLAVTPQRCAALVPGFERDRVAEEDLAGLDWPVESYPWEDSGAYERVLRDLCDGVAPATDLDSGAGIGIEPAVRALRVVLHPAEIARYARLGAEVAAIVQERALILRQGEREDAVARDLSQALLACGILPATVMVGADERAARYRHPLPADAPIRHLALLAVAVRRSGLWISCSRMVSFGPLTEEKRRAARAVMEADAAYIEGSATSATLGEAFEQGVRAYQRAGFVDGWRQHHQGGITGYAAREIRAEPGASYPLQPHMAFAWNPWLNGMKSEDTIIVGEDRMPRVLTLADGWPREQLHATGHLIATRPAILER